VRPNKALQLTRRRRSTCQALQPPGGRTGGRFAGRPPDVSSPSTGGAQLSALSVSQPLEESSEEQTPVLIDLCLRIHALAPTDAFTGFSACHARPARSGSAAAEVHEKGIGGTGVARIERGFFCNGRGSRPRRLAVFGPLFTLPLPGTVLANKALQLTRRRGVDLRGAPGGGRPVGRSIRRAPAACGTLLHGRRAAERPIR